MVDQDIKTSRRVETDIAVIPGDFIGPEIVAEARKTLAAVAERFGHVFRLTEVLAGGAAFDAYGKHLPEATLAVCRQADAVLKGPLGGPTAELNHPKWANVEREALLGLRAGLQLFANLRPVLARDSLLDFSPLRRERIKNVDMVIVRELASGIYFGPQARRTVAGEEQALDTELYRASEIRRIAQAAFALASTRRRHVTLVGKSNVLLSSVLWREATEDVAAAYPDVKFDYMHVDNASMQLVMQPGQFDVLLTSNMFGDILSDQAGAIAGSIGVLPSASLSKNGVGLYEPVHGSAPDIAGQGVANPIAQILSAAELLRHSLRLDKEAQAVEAAVDALLNKGFRTADLAAGRNDVKLLGTKAVGDFIVEHILRQ